MVYLQTTAKYLLRNVKQKQSMHHKLFASVQQQQRGISVLYITGDKATKSYAPLHPYMDFEGTLSNLTPLEESIKARGLKIDLDALKVKYEKYKKMHQQIEKVENERDLLSVEIRVLSKANTANAKEKLEELKKDGVKLRNELKALKAQSYPIDEDFVHSFLNLPNTLHPNCPINDLEKLLYSSTTPRCEEERPTHLSHKDRIRFQTNDRYYLMDELCEFDVESMQALTQYFVDKGGFLQTSNPDFARLVLLEASAVPLETFHMVREKEPPSAVNHAYLTGGASFEAYLAAFARLMVYPSALPLPCVTAGRRYEKVKVKDGQPHNLFTATQTYAVQTFVATQTAKEADEYMEKILNLAVDFYKELGIHFRIVYANVSALTNAECLRANIEMYSPAEKRYICVGSVSNYSDYVSKRVMFCIRKNQDYIFPHLVSGPVLYTNRLIAVLLENGVKVENCKLLGAVETEYDFENEAMDKFKDLFK